MSDDDVNEGAVSPESGRRPVGELPQLPLDFEAFYLGHQEFFHAFAEIHLGGRRTSEEVVHHVFQDILASWDDLLKEGDLEQQTLATLTRHVKSRLERDRRDPAYLIAGPITQALRAVRERLELADGTIGLYDAIHALPARQFNAIVIRYVLGYSTAQVARFMGLDERTAGYHVREAKKRLAAQLRVDVSAARRPKTTRNRKKGTAR